MTTVWIYVDTNMEVGDRDHLKVFANRDAADEWLKDNDPESVAFGYEVDGQAKRERPDKGAARLARGRGSSRE